MLLETFTAMLLSGSIAYADNNEKISPNITVVFDKKICAELNKISPNYKAGVDVRGNKVVPANLDDNDNEIIVPINIDIAKKYGYYDDKGIDLGLLYSGDIRVIDGRTYFNGYLLENEDVPIFDNICK